MTIDIVCATDDNYAHHCGIMLTSLFENNRSCKFNVHILTATLNVENVDRYKQLAVTYGHSIDIILVEESLFDQCVIRESDHVSIATYYRFIVSSILPEDVKTILYLDCDMVITGDITDLITDPMYDLSSDIAIAAVSGASEKYGECYNRLEYDQSKGYFNAGVLVINVQYWRDNDVSNRLFEYVQNHQDVKFHDQDTLNYVLRDNKLLLPIKYNMQHLYLYNDYCAEFDMYTEVFDNLKDIRIVHYTSNDKPWMKMCKHPFANEYIKYKEISLWSDEPLLKPCRQVSLYTKTMRQFRSEIKKILVKIGLISPFVEKGYIKVDDVL
ncbi:MAG: glycosyltransferase family 8 protein [Rikenellaceae bacterium]